MSARYLLPCECGESLVIQIGQAGQDLTCACGRKLTVPGMRDIRRLSSAESGPTKIVKPAVASGFSVARAFFAAGVAVTFLALAFAGFMLFQRSQLLLGPNPGEQRSIENEMIDSMPLEQAWEAWTAFRGEGLGTPSPDPHIVNRMIYDDAGRAILTALVVAGIAGALAAAAALVDRKATK